MAKKMISNNETREVEENTREKTAETLNHMFQSLTGCLNVQENWLIGDSLQKINEGTSSLVEELMNAYAHLNRNEFASYCVQVGLTTRKAKSLLTDAYGITWRLAKPCKPKTRPVRKKPSVKMMFAVDWLQRYLLSVGRNAVPARLCFFEATKTGISLRTLRRAKELMGVSSIYRNGRWYWWLDR